jgi:hypothetical protein
MLFHEIYGKYYQTVGAILRQATEQGSISRQELRRIVSENAFSESTMYIPKALQGSWFLLDADGKSVLRNAPTKPFTLTEKRWLKAILQDPRIRLFDLPEQELEDVEPLFTQDMFCWFDRYEDGDPYEDPGYIQNFRQLTRGIIQKQNVKLLYKGANGMQTHFCFPYRLEYSEKDDKFRLLAIQKERPLILNLSKIVSCELLEPMSEQPKIPEPQKVKLVLELINQRNALERAMLHFSHLEKETVQMDKRKYRITLWYEPRDERELLIRVLSFGPRLKVVEPTSLVAQIKNRIEKQQNLRTL